MSGRQIALLAAVAFAIASPIIQMLGGVGLTAGQFSRSGDTTLRAASYAFSIWSVIYAGLAAFAVYQAVPRRRDDALVETMAAPALVAITGTGLWIWASAFDLRWLTVAIIVVSAIYLSVGLVRAVRAPGAPSRSGQVFVLWPLGMLAGWLTIAAALNILTVMTAESLLDDAARPAAFVGVVVVLAAALVELRATRLLAFGAPVAWGFVAVGVAERAAKSDVATLALIAAVLVGGYGLRQTWIKRRRA